jgi:omega-amidase
MNEINISLIQSRLRWREPAGNRSNLESKLQDLGDTNLIVFPETFTTGFMAETSQTDEEMTGETVSWMQSISVKHDAAVTGSVVIQDGGRRNRLLFVTPDGDVQFYDKRHLFAFAGEDKRYVAGQERKIFNYLGWRICPQICYDLRFPVWCRYRDDYDLLLFVANWPGKRIDAWSSLLKARAIENQCYVAAVNRVGKDGNDFEYPGASAVYDPLGETLLKLGPEEETATTEISLSQVKSVREQLPFYREAEHFELRQ